MKKSEQENIPAVTWIPMESDVEARIYLKSASDYLSEPTNELSSYQRKLRLSPEIRNDIDKAEKLVEDVNRQISQMRFNDFVVDDMDLDRCYNERNRGENIYIRNIVAKTFQKGYYDSSFSNMFRQESLKSKLTISSKTPNTISQITKISQIQPLNVHQLFSPISQRSNLKPPPEKCLLCKTCKSIQKGNISPKCKNTKISYSSVKSSVRNINQNKTEKLNIQKGPAIDIQGEFSVQTAKIVDIKPTESVSSTLDGYPVNIITYEFHQKSSMNGNSLTNGGQISKKHESNINCKKSYESNGMSNTFKSQIVEHKCRKSRKKITVNKLQENLLPDHRLSEKNEEHMNKLTISEDITIDLSDFGLCEPLIFLLVDSLLEEQRKLIRKVRSVNEKFDKFLATKLPCKIDFSLEGDTKSKIEYSSREQKAEKDYGVNETQKHTSTQAIIKSSIGIDDKFSKTSLDHKYDPTMMIENKIEDPKTDFVSMQLVNTLSTDFKNINSKVHAISDQSFLSSKKSEIQKLRISNNEENYSIVEISQMQSKINNKVLSSNSSLIIHTSEYSDTKSNTAFVAKVMDTQHLKNSNEITNLTLKNKLSFHQNVNSVAEVEGQCKNVIINEEDSVNKHKRVIATNEPVKMIKYLVETDIVNGQTYEVSKLNNYSMNNINKQKEENEKQIIHKNEAERKKDEHEKFGDTLDDSSQKTFHLIESLSEASLNDIDEYSNVSIKLSALSKDKILNQFFKMKIITIDDAGDEKSSSLKIEKSRKKIEDVSENIEIIPKEMTKLKSDHRCNLDLDSQKIGKTVIENYIPIINDRYNLSSTRPYMTVLAEKNITVQDCFQKQKLSLLKKLDSCSIPHDDKHKQLFTSTVLDDIEHFNSFVRSHGFQPESSSETHSEGEVCFSSSTSYSLGEIRRKIKLSNSLITKDSSSNSINANICLCPSSGESHKAK